MAKYKWVSAGAITVFILLMVYYGQFIIYGNHTVFSSWGDGFKNYYTIAYYLNYDSGPHFTGMNYPYGENVIYTDNQPLVSWLLKPVSMAFPAVLTHLQSMLIWQLMLGHLLCYFVLYKILYIFKLPAAFAALFAVFITMLSPQLTRINGHFSLGYTFFIPLLIWWLINLISTGYSLKYMVLLTLLITGSIFVHPYYFAMAALFITCLSAVLFLRTSGGFIKKISGFIPLTTLVIAFTVFKLYIAITDPVNDRPSSPWGFIESRATIADILLQSMSFTYQGIKAVFPDIQITFNGEGQAYIGVVAIGVTLLLLMYSIVPPLRNRMQHLIIPPLAITLVLSAIPVLLFSMAFPFSINEWFESLLTYAPSTIKQFRATGRFAWVFYYVISITASLVVYRVYLSFNTKSFAFIFLIITSSFWFIDINTTNLCIKKNIFAYKAAIHTEEYKHAIKQELQKYGYTANNFQALAPIPLYLNGSEKLHLESILTVVSMEASLATGLPLVAGQMSRTSQSCTFNIANLFGGHLIKKDVLQLFNNKPLLGMLAVEPRDENERELIEKSKYLFTYDDVKYYEIPVNAFADRFSEVKHQITNNKENLYKKGNYFTYDSLSRSIYKSFDNTDVDYAIFGKGAIYSNKQDVWLYKDTLPNAIDNNQYEISAWIYADARNAAFPTLSVKQIDIAGNEVERFDCNPKVSTQTYGKWVRTSNRFTLNNKANRIYVKGMGTFATYDELMIRPVESIVITHFTATSRFSYNNFPIY